MLFYLTWLFVHNTPAFDGIVHRSADAMESPIKLDGALINAFIVYVERAQDAVPTSYKTRLLHGHKREKKTVAGLSLLHKQTEIQLTQIDLYHIN